MKKTKLYYKNMTQVYEGTKSETTKPQHTVERENHFLFANRSSAESSLISNPISTLFWQSMRHKLYHQLITESGSRVRSLLRRVKNESNTFYSSDVARPWVQWTLNESFFLFRFGDKFAQLFITFRLWQIIDDDEKLFLIHNLLDQNANENWLETIFSSLLVLIFCFRWFSELSSLVMLHAMTVANKLQAHVLLASVKTK